MRKKLFFNNGGELKFTGQDLTKILVEGMYADLKKYIANDEKVRGKLQLGSKPFIPERAVVAIPNNFTANKIQDLIDCFENLDDFKEVRYIYESEAVYFYHLSQQKEHKNEVAVVFDMGGATINVTAIKLDMIDNKYHVEILNKLGYGVGGDTIDYHLIKYLYENANNLLGNIENPFNKELVDKDLKAKLLNLVNELKQQIVTNYNNKKADNLINYAEFRRMIILHLYGGTNQSKLPTLDVYQNHPVFVDMTLKEPNNQFLHLAFEDGIYKNVDSIVDDVCKNLLEGTKVNKVIFSGRSTLFPQINERAMKRFNDNGFKASKFTFVGDELKTAVAKGACWYGVQKNAITLSNIRTNAIFGVKKRMPGDDFKFLELIGMNKLMNKPELGIATYTGQQAYQDGFALDNQDVEFYQVMGSNVKEILRNKEQHKYSLIGSIHINYLTERLAMKVTETDFVTYSVRLTNKELIKGTGVVKNQEISDANDEGYTWAVE